MSHSLVVNPIVSRGFAFDPFCKVEMIVTQGYGSIVRLKVKSLPRTVFKSWLKKSIRGNSSLIKDCSNG